MRKRTMTTRFNTIHAIRVRAAALLCAAACLLAGAGRAQELKNFELTTSRTNINVNEPFTATLTIEMKSGSPDSHPTTPDFGKLDIQSGPSSNQSYSSFNGRVKITQSYQWSLVALTEGSYTIGPSALKIGNREYRTTPITLKATKRISQELPVELRDEPILFPRSNNAKLNNYLKGRLFLRCSISNPKPHVGEPVIVNYDLYTNEIPADFDMNRGVSVNVQGAISEELFHVSQLQPRQETIGGKTYNVSQIYTLAVIPSSPGELIFDGYNMEGVWRGSRSRDPFASFFNMGERVLIPSPKIRLDVQPTPSEGAPAGFQGTVGGFTLKAETDANSITADDIVTLQLTLEGRGAIELADLPAFKPNKDFDVVDQSDYIDRWKKDDDYGGKKVVEISLRPSRAGKLTIPGVQYPLFDPYEKKFKTLSTEPIEIAVAPGSGIRHAQPASTGAAGPGQPQEMTADANTLRYIRFFGSLRTGHPDLLLHNPLFWLVQLAAAAALAWTVWAERRRANINPDQQRQSRAQRRFEKRLRAIGKLPAGSTGEIEAAAHQLEQAVRAGVADHFKRSAEGLTWREIEFLLQSRSVPSEVCAELESLTSQWSVIRYAPVNPGEADLRRWIDRARALMKEAFAR